MACLLKGQLDQISYSWARSFSLETLQLLSAAVEKSETHLILPSFKSPAFSAWMMEEFLFHS